MNKKCEALNRKFRGLKDMKDKIRIKKQLIDVMRSDFPDDIYAYQEQLDSMEDERKALEKDMLKAFLSIEDPEMCKVLIGLYIDFKKWPDIAEDVGRSVRHVMKVRNMALELLVENSAEAYA